MMITCDNDFSEVYMLGHCQTSALDLLIQAIRLQVTGGSWFGVQYGIMSHSRRLQTVCGPTKKLSDNTASDNTACLMPCCLTLCCLTRCCLMPRCLTLTTFCVINVFPDTVSSEAALSESEAGLNETRWRTVQTPRPGAVLAEARDRMLRPNDVLNVYIVLQIKKRGMIRQTYLFNVRSRTNLEPKASSWKLA